MAARPARDHRVGGRHRSARLVGAGQRRHLLRAGLLGLFAPYWRSDARGAIVGLSRFNTKAHLARATLEAICFQTRAVLDAMVKDSGVRLDGAEGRRRRNSQQYADAAAGRRAWRSGRPAGRRRNYRARRGLCGGVGDRLLEDLDDLRQNWKMDRQWEPKWSADQRDAAYAGWEKAVQRTLDWAE